VFLDVLLFPRVCEFDRLSLSLSIFSCFFSISSLFSRFVPTLSMFYIFLDFIDYLAFLGYLYNVSLVSFHRCCSFFSFVSSLISLVFSISILCFSRFFVFKRSHIVLPIFSVFLDSLEFFVFVVSRCYLFLSSCLDSLDDICFIVS